MTNAKWAVLYIKMLSLQFKAVGKPMNLNVCVVIGGKDMVFQGKELADRPHIIVATPGRCDH
jgi:superfamily II DNA/RNA helicase